ncbi:MAG: type VI secretion system contractile sheath large subunit, partial [Pseudomonadales bacterium]|nr:type VI secretion system contractile sheath large subunit [Pseudomonadales bacterium]
SKFDVAAQEIMSWSEDVAPATSSDPAAATATSADQTISYGDSLLDSILAQAPTPSGPDYDIEQLVKSIVAPFVQPKADPRQKEMLAVVDEAVSDLMRKIMHHSRFQALESSWRALYQLTKKLETDNRLKVFILDTDLDAVIEDAGTSETLEASQLYKKIISERQTEGGTPFRVILADYTFHPRADHLAAATHCIHLAQSSGGTLLSSASPAWAGCDSLDRTPDPDDWQSLPENDVMASWQQVRAMPGSEHAAFYGVRHMLRLPYGKRTAPTREFEFEELPANNAHNYYLWASGAWLGTLMIAEQYSQSGWQIQTDAAGQIDGFPMHVYTEDGETVTTPCAEIYLTDAASKRLHDAGLAVLRSIQNKDSIIIPGINSIKPNTSLHGGWTR